MLDVFTGVVRCQATAAPPNSVQGRLYVVNSGEAAALPPICPRCDTDFRRSAAALRFGSIARASSDQARCWRVLWPARCPRLTRKRRSRKLVIFSDSRQDAAKLSAGMELDHFRDMVRVCLMGAHESFIRGYADLLRTLSASAPALLAAVEKINPQLAQTLGTARRTR